MDGGIKIKQENSKQLVHVIRKSSEIIEQGSACYTFIDAQAYIQRVWDIVRWRCFFWNFEAGITSTYVHPTFFLRTQLVLWIKKANSLSQEWQFLS